MAREDEKMEAAVKGYLAFMVVWLAGFMAFGWYVAFAGRQHGDTDGSGIFVMSFLTFAIAVGASVWLWNAKVSRSPVSGLRG